MKWMDSNNKRHFTVEMYGSSNQFISIFIYLLLFIMHILKVICLSDLYLWEFVFLMKLVFGT